MTMFKTVGVGGTVRFKFTTNAATGAAVAPLSAFEAADVILYKDGSATQRTSQSGWTMTSPFDSITGLHQIAIDLSDNTDAGFYAVGSDYELVLSPDTETVDGVAVVAVIGGFRIVAAESSAGVPKVDVSHFNGTAGTFASGRPEVNMSHIAGSAVSTSTAQIGVNVVQAGATAWGSGAITRAAFAADTGLQSARSNTAQAGGSTSITLDASAGSVTDIYRNDLIIITGGTGVGQARVCTAYNGTTKVATVSAAWATNPDNTSTFAVIPCDWPSMAQLPTALVSGRMDSSIGAVAAGVINRAAFAADSGLVTIRSGTAQAGFTAAITLDSGASSVNAFYQCALILLTGGTGAGQSRYIISYDGTTKIATVGTQWATVPDSSTTFAILPGDVQTHITITQNIQSRLPAALGANGNMKADVRDYNGTAGTFASGRPEVNASHAGGTAWGSGAITAGSIAAAAFTAAKFAADAIDANALAASAVTEIQSGLATAANLATLTGYVDTEVAAIKAVTDLLPNGGALTSLATAAALATVQSDTNDIQTRLPAALDDAGLMQSVVVAMEDSTIGAATLTAAAGNKLADHVLRRSLASARASSFGDSVVFRSLVGAASKLVNKITASDVLLTVYAEDDTTSFGTQAITSDPAAEPITGLDTA